MNLTEFFIHDWGILVLIFGVRGYQYFKKRRVKK